MEPFTYVGLPCRVVFGAGSVARLADELAALGGKRALICATPGRTAEAEALATALGEASAGVAATALPFTPVEAVRETLEIADAAGADSLVSYGGGNAVGLAKVLADERDLPYIAVVTTYSGSETTSIQAVREAGRRVQLGSPRMLPKTVIYDPELTLDLPPSVAIPSGFNSMAQAVSSLFAESRNPVTALMAEEGIRRMAAALARIARDPRDVDGRGEALYGAFLCGSTVMPTGTTIQHKVCHVLAGDFGLTHAETHTVVLPHVLHYNRDSVPGAAAAIARALGAEADDAPGALFDTLGRCGAPQSLKEIGMPADGLDRAVELILTRPYYNPRPYERDAIRALLDNAYAGRRPGSA